MNYPVTVPLWLDLILITAAVSVGLLAGAWVQLGKLNDPQTRGSVGTLLALVWVATGLALFILAATTSLAPPAGVVGT